MSLPLVSIIVPMYNAENSIRKTLDSIKNQSYLNYEVLIVDDLSTDDSIDIINQEYLNDKRFKLFSLDKKGGASMARNLAIERAEGKYIAFLDADDTWFPEKLEKQVAFMNANDYAFTYTNYAIYDTDRKTKSQMISPDSITFESLLKRNSIGCLTVMYDREKVGLIQIPKLDKRNDYALWLKILRLGYVGYLLNETCSTYFISSNSLSRKSGKINLLKYHYLMYNGVLDYGKFKSTIYSVRNAFYYLID